MTSPAADQTVRRKIASDLIDEVARTCPEYRSGTRPIHAPGIAATGWFSATPVASSYTAAAHFSGERVPVTVRFSNGTGAADEPDATAQVRGMAVKFHLGTVASDEHGVLQSEVETDLIAMTLPVFFARTVPEFRAFLAAAVPTSSVARSRWRRAVDLLRLETPRPKVRPGVLSGEPGIFDYAAHHREACPAVAYLGAKFVPESYTTCSYHAVHAFALTAPDGSTRWARFHWEPLEGVRSAPPDAAIGNFLRLGLQDRIATGRAEFVLRIQLAEGDDDPRDPTTPWPARRRRVVMGHLRLTEVPADQHHGCELLSFNPTRLVPGIAGAPDPTLIVRGDVYALSHARRAHADAARTSPAPLPAPALN